jgi:hypothetical protein
MCSPYSEPQTTSAHLAAYRFCVRFIISVLRLNVAAFRLSLLAVASQVPVAIRLYLKFTDDPGACRLSFERVLDAIISRSS